MSKKKTQYIVTSDGIDCGLALPEELGLGEELLPPTGLLVKRPHDPKVYGGEKSAQNRIDKTLATVSRLRGAPFDITKIKSVQPLLELGKMAIHKLN